MHEFFSWLFWVSMWSGLGVYLMVCGHMVFSMWIEWRHLTKHEGRLPPDGGGKW
jgi:hypothetical protein